MIQEADGVHSTIWWLLFCLEGLYCKRPGQCLTSSEILTLHPLIARRVCSVPPPPPPPAHTPPLVRGEDTLAAWWRWGGGSIVRKTPDTALYSIYSIYVNTLCSYVIEQGKDVPMTSTRG
jgi:hypothetical protein